MLDISVVINTKDRARNLRLCLAALRKQTLAPARWEIVVVDDGSRDDAPRKVVEAYKGESVCRFVALPHSGRSAARNAGIDAAQGRYVLFLGDDVLLEPNALAEHLRTHEAHPQSAVVGLYERDSIASSKVFAECVETCYFARISDPRNASWRYFYTGNLSVERARLAEVGGFDENFFRYGWEDMDLGVRLERAGVRIVYQPKARGVHHHPHVSLQSLCRTEYEQGFSAWYFFSKWSDDPDVQADRSWPLDLAAIPHGSPLRRAIGRAAIHVCEKVIPIAPLLRRLYERLIWSYRYEGMRAGMRRYKPLLDRWRAGALTEAQTRRRFQR